MVIRSQTKLAEILYSSCPRGQSSERDNGTCLICRDGTAEESDIIRTRTESSQQRAGNQGERNRCNRGLGTSEEQKGHQELEQG